MVNSEWTICLLLPGLRSVWLFPDPVEEVISSEHRLQLRAREIVLK